VSAAPDAGTGRDATSVPPDGTDGGEPSGRPEAGVIQPPPSHSGITVQLMPGTVALAPGGSVTFRCSVMGSTNTGCRFSVEESAGGKVTSSGAYTAPTTAGTYHVLAASAADATATDRATVVVRTVSACPTDNSAVGTWENVTPPAFLSPSNLETMAVAVDNVNQIVYAAAGNITNGCGPCVGTGI
jgi:hypothetical protein